MGFLTTSSFPSNVGLAAKEKKDLYFRTLSLERQRSSYAETAVEIEAELQAVTAELTTLSGIIASLPDGELKDENVTKKRGKSPFTILQQVFNINL